MVSKVRREKDMKLTLKKDVNLHSLTLQHNILLQATMLLEGREDGLKTEKEIYLMIAMVDMLVQENLLELCNQDTRELSAIIIEDIEPFFNNEIMNSVENKEAYQTMLHALLERCDKIVERRYSIVGVIDSLLITLGTLTSEEKAEILEKTGEVAAKVYEKRTEQMTEQAQETNSKLEALVQQYQRKSIKENDAE